MGDSVPTVFTSLEAFVASAHEVLGLMDQSLSHHREKHPDHACETMYEEIMVAMEALAGSASINYAEMLNRLMLFRIGKRRAQAQMN